MSSPILPGAESESYTQLKYSARLALAAKGRPPR